MRFERHSPGNGTLYRVGIVENDDDNRMVLVWLNSRPCGKSFSFDPGGFLHFSYLMEKLDLQSTADATALLTYLHEHTGVEVALP